VTLAVVGLLAGLALGRPDLTAFGAAFATVAFAAVLLAESPGVDIRVEVDSTRVLEEDLVNVRVVVEALSAIERLDVALVLPLGLSLTEGDSPVGLRLGAGESRSVELVVRADQWGLQRIGTVVVRARDRTGLIVWEGAAADTHPLRVLPGPAALAHLVRPRRTRVHAGNQVARVRGPGTEFAEIRPYQAGDSVRSVNWRLTARRGEPWINDHHPERSTDVVIFLDTFGTDSLADGVRAAAAISIAHLDQRDRVGLIGFGGSLRWLEPGGGRTQEYRIIDALITTQVFVSEAWRSLAVVPRRCLPPNALVLAVSPMQDQRAIAALSDLRARGIDLAVVQVVATGDGSATSSAMSADPRSLGPLAARVLDLELDAVRSRFARLGVPVASWSPEGPLAGTVEEVIAFRRRLRTGAV
jgi:uncharacterized protein (DUF58 family)